MAAATDSRGAIRVVSDEEILAAYRLLASSEGMFCEPASAASVAGLLKYGADGAEQVVCVLTGRGLKDPETAIANNDGRVIPCAPRSARSRRRCWVIRRRVVRVPASSANLGPGLRLHGRRARAAPGARGGGDRRVRRRDRPAGARAGRENLCVRAFERLHPADGFTFRIRSEIPLSGGLGSSAAAIVAGLMAADHLFELDADLLALRQRARGPPRQRRRRAARRLRRLRRRRAPRASSRRRAWRRWRSCPREAVRTRAARAALPAAGAAGGRRLQRRPRRAADARPGPRRLGPASRAACTTACTSSAARTCSRARYELAARARELGALGATISGAGPTVLVWCFYEQTGAVAEALRGGDRGLGDAAARPVRAAGRLRRSEL